MDNIYKQQLENVIKYNRASRMRRLLKDPIHFISSYLIRKAASGLKKTLRVSARTFWGDNMDLIIPSLGVDLLFSDRLYEEGLTRMLIEYLRPGMTFFDIGAYLGYYTLLASRLVGPGGHVYSFEPTPHSFEMLRVNTRNRSNAHLYNLAVFSKSENVYLMDCGTEFSAFNSIYEPRIPAGLARKSDLGKIEARAVMLDEFIVSKGIRPDFIKIDAESAEYDILQGMGRIITGIKPMITLEVGDTDVKRSVSSKDLIAYLTDRGYRAYEFNGKKIVPSQPRGWYRYDNILFLPE